MSFVRQVDSAALDPVRVYGPYVQESESRNQVTTLMDSSSTSVAYFPIVPRTGEFRVLFDSYTDANAARAYFGVASLFEFLGASTTPGEYIVSDGRIILSAGDPDPAMSFLFAVPAQAIRVEQADLNMWSVFVPYQEVPV